MVCFFTGALGKRISLCCEPLALGFAINRKERVRCKLRCSKFVLWFEGTPSASAAAASSPFLVISGRHYEQAIFDVIVFTED